MAQLSRLPRTADVCVELHQPMDAEIEVIRWVQDGAMDVPWGREVPAFVQNRPTLLGAEPKDADILRRFGALLMVLVIAQSFQHACPQPKRDLRVELRIRGEQESTHVSLQIRPIAWALSFPGCCLDPDPNNLPNGIEFSWVLMPGA